MKQKTNKKQYRENQRNTNLVVWKVNKTGKAQRLMTKREKSQIDNIRVKEGLSLLIH